MGTGVAENVHAEHYSITQSEINDSAIERVRKTSSGVYYVLSFSINYVHSFDAWLVIQPLRAERAVEEAARWDAATSRQAGRKYSVVGILVARSYDVSNITTIVMTEYWRLHPCNTQPTRLMTYPLAQY